MASSYHDNNHTPVLMATSSADGVTPVVVYADATTHRLLTKFPATSGSATAQTTANANVVQVTVGAADGSYLVGGSVLCTAYTSGNLNLSVTYTDVNNASVTLALQGHFTSGYGINVSGLGDFEAQVTQIRAKAGTTITISTTGTFTLTYNVYGTISQIA